MNEPRSMLDCQVWVQDVALELTRLDKRLGKITRSVTSLGFFEGSSVEIELPERVHRLRCRYLQQATVLLLELAQMAGQERLRREEAEPDGLPGELL